MHDLKFVRDHQELIRDLLIKRNQDPGPIDAFGELDRRRRALLGEIEELKGRRNRANDEIAALKKEKKDAEAILSEMKVISVKIKGLEPDLSKVEEEEKDLLMRIPNLVHESVPIGSEKDNLLVRMGGEIREFPFTPRHHYELGELWGLIDFMRAAKIAGARYAVLLGEISKLNRALINLMLDVHTQKHGYIECRPPSLVNSASLYGTGNLPKFAEDLFRVEGRDLWLIPTAEVPVTNLFRDEVLSLEKLPISLCAYTPCFRSEAGAAGKDTRGLIRMHEFDKVELVKFSSVESSLADLEQLTSDAEDILKILGLPYRVVALASGDLGFSSHKTYDLEVWLPGANTYREISSCSLFTDFQARRANIRLKNAKGVKLGFAHTLNGSGLAVGRTLAAILENYQKEDGTVAIPEALRPYMGEVREIGGKKG
jgi:seryl-tRNA synthetase